MVINVGEKPPRRQKIFRRKSVYFVVFQVLNKWTGYMCCIPRLLEQNPEADAPRDDRPVESSVRQNLIKFIFVLSSYLCMCYTK